MRKEMVIIGGGPAGLAAAVSAREHGINDILILERDAQLGGILNQCIHNGFGLHKFREELTGPEYAFKYSEQVEQLGIEYMLHTMVISLDKNKHIVAMSSEHGLIEIDANAIILAMGCRERPRGALNIPGCRPAGIYSAGTAQYFVNIEGELPGKEVVILGSGDIGLIMARRMTFEGAHVQAVVELMSYSGGLKRNIVQCLDDYNIPLMLSHTITNIHGKDRVEGVTIAQVDEALQPIKETEQYISCDTILFSVGLLPENELSEKAGVLIDNITGGPVVNSHFETGIPGVFACGNVLHVHDLVDYVSQEAERAGEMASKYLKNTGVQTIDEVKIEVQSGIRYSVPQKISKDEKGPLSVKFRVNQIYKDVWVYVYADQKLILKKKKKIMAPGEMEEVIIKAELMESCYKAEKIILELKKEEV